MTTELSYFVAGLDLGIRKAFSRSKAEETRA